MSRILMSIEVANNPFDPPGFKLTWSTDYVESLALEVAGKSRSHCIPISVSRKEEEYHKFKTWREAEAALDIYRELIHRQHLPK